MANRVLLRCAASVSRHLQRRAVISSIRLTSNCLTGQHKPVVRRYLETGVRHMCAKANTDFIINIQDEEDFEKKVMQSSKPVVVDFHAHWCGPCKLLGPRLESLIASKKGKVVLAKVDVDELGELAMNYRVMSIPMVLGIKNGKTVNQFIGLQDDDQLETFIEKLLL